MDCQLFEPFPEYIGIVFSSQYRENLTGSIGCKFLCCSVLERYSVCRIGVVYVLHLTDYRWRVARGASGFGGRTKLVIAVAVPNYGFVFVEIW